MDEAQAGNDVPDLELGQHSITLVNERANEANRAFARAGSQVRCELAVLHPLADQLEGRVPAKDAKARDNMWVAKQLPGDGLCPPDLRNISRQKALSEMAMRTRLYISVFLSLLERIVLSATTRRSFFARCTSDMAVWYIGAGGSSTNVSCTSKSAGRFGVRSHNVRSRRRPLPYNGLVGERFSSSWREWFSSRGEI
jgi:hypothetical protein